MTQRQINQLEMARAVQNYLNANTATWTTVPIVTTFKNELDELLLRIEENAEAQEASRVYLGEAKANQRRLVAEKTDILNDALEAYASVNELAELEQKAAKSFTDYLRLPNQDFKISVKEMVGLLEAQLPELADYGVTEAQLTDLKSSYDKFLSLSGEPQQYRIASVQATQSLSELMDELNALLNTKLDKVMKSFKRTQSNFYSGYLASRTIIDN